MCCRCPAGHFKQAERHKITLCQCKAAASHWILPTFLIFQPSFPYHQAMPFSPAQGGAHPLQVPRLPIFFWNVPDCP